MATRVQASPQISVTPIKLLNFTVSQFPYLKSGAHNSSYLVKTMSGSAHRNAVTLPITIIPMKRPWSPGTAQQLPLLVPSLTQLLGAHAQHFGCWAAWVVSHPAAAHGPPWPQVLLPQREH